MAAMIVAGLGLGAFYGAVSQISRLALSAAQTARAVRHEENLLAVAQTINPAQTPEGRIELGGYVVRWTSESVVDKAPILQASGAPSPFAVALYDVRVVVESPSENMVRTITVRRTGWTLERSEVGFKQIELRPLP